MCLLPQPVTEGLLDDRAATSFLPLSGGLDGAVEVGRHADSDLQGSRHGYDSGMSAFIPTRPRRCKALTTRVQRNETNAAVATCTKRDGAIPTTSTSTIVMTIVASNAGRRVGGTTTRSPSAMYICTSTPR